jgi:hypothetical protein
VTRLNDFSRPIALAAMACLIAMGAISLVSGVSQETFEIVRPPAIYAADLREHAAAVRALFGLDAVFLVLYAVFFVLFAQRLANDQTRPWVIVGLIFMLATALLDMAEDHHILSLLYAVELGQQPTWDQLGFQHTLSSVKFHLSYVGLFLYGLAIPRARWTGVALALLLTVGTVLQGAWLYAAPPAMLPAGNLGRLAGFLAGFALALPLLRPEPPPR